MSAVIPLALALTLGGVAAFLFRDIINKRLTGPRPAAGGKVVVVRQDLPIGQELMPPDLILVDAPAKLAPKGSFTTVEKATGRVLATSVTQGQMLVEGMLAPEGSLAGLEAAVPPGMRAVSIDINEVTGLAGLVRQGSFVDVVTTLRDDDTKETIGRTILQNVKVSAIGQRITPRTDNKGAVLQEVSKSATLIVTPAQAEALDLAATRGKLRLVLRNSRDTTSVQTQGVKLTTLVGGREGGSALADAGKGLMEQFAAAMKQQSQRPPPPAPATRPAQPAAPAPQKVLIQVIRGGTESTKEFQVLATPEAESTTPPGNGPADVKEPVSSVTAGPVDTAVGQAVR